MGYLCNVVCEGSEEAVQNSILISDVIKSEFLHLQNKLVMGCQKCMFFRTHKWLNFKRAADNLKRILHSFLHVPYVFLKCSHFSNVGLISNKCY